MSTPIIVTGDNISLPVTLKKNGATFVIDAAATVKAMIVSRDHRESLTAAVAQVSTAAGADWPNSLVVVEFAPADTSGIAFQGEALIEIEVTEGIKKTWFVTVEIVRGNIA